MMLNKVILSTLILAAAFFVFTSPSSAQNSQPAAPQPSAAEPLGENDDIPFMRTEQAAASEPSSASLLVKTIGAMALIVGLIFAGAWAAKKMGFGSSRPTGAEMSVELSVLNTVSMGGGKSLCAIRFGSRTLLVGSTAQNFTLLAEDAAGDDPIERPVPRSVSEMLADSSITFDEEFERASSQLNLLGQVGRSV